MTESFAQLGVPELLVAALDARRITEPFEIQALTLPDALEGRDILGRAPTGSGKTMAFGIPALARLATAQPAAPRRPRGLILSPTRELAEQIRSELEPLADAVDRRILAVYGGVGFDRQLKGLNRGVDLLVACPGRLLDLIDSGAVHLGDVEIAVVDEADRMADMGFLPDVRKLLDQTSPDRQTVLFSATLDRDVKVLIDGYQNDPVRHEVAEPEPDLSVMVHRFIRTPKTDRVWLAADLVADAGPTIIFARTRHGVDRLARQLKQEGIKAGNLHGGRTQKQRDAALSAFTDGRVEALVCTDVAARGIHVDGIECVIHYDPPAEYKDYVHRSGRTARAGAAGTVISFLDKPQVKESQRMQLRLGIEADLEDQPERQPRSSRPPAIRDRSAERSRSDKAKARTSRSGSSKPSSKRSSTKPSKHGPSKHRSSKPRNDAPRSEADDSPSKRRSKQKHKAGAGRSMPEGSSANGAQRSTSRAGAGKPKTRTGTGKPKSNGAKRSTSSDDRTESTTTGRGRGRSSAAKKKAGVRRRSESGSGSNGSAPAKGRKSRTRAKLADNPRRSKRSGKPRPKNRKKAAQGGKGRG